jgi:Uma2 family endonuclease
MVVEQTTERAELMTLQELIRLYEAEGPFELIDGERVPLNPMVMGHNNKSRKLYNALTMHLYDRGIGEVFYEASFVLLYDANWVKGSREPDILFVSAERWLAYLAATPDWEDKPLILVPDLVIEVIAPTDRYSDMDAKVDRYLEDGVKVVWVVDPQQKTITIRSRSEYKKLRIHDTLTGGGCDPRFCHASTGGF